MGTMTIWCIGLGWAAEYTIDYLKLMPNSFVPVELRFPPRCTLLMQGTVDSVLSLDWLS